jgi:hypothetical protein
MACQFFTDDQLLRKIDPKLGAQSNDQDLIAVRPAHFLCHGGSAERAESQLQ